ncbi:MAG: DUF6288 domain-containing protein [Phycisphaeraceae bacterium]
MVPIRFRRWMWVSSRLLLILLVCGVSWGVGARSAWAEQEVVDLTAGGERGDGPDWNLGPTGMRGWMWNDGARGADGIHTHHARQILVTQVDSGSPADGVIKVGDVILGVDGRAFERDARIAFGEAITQAEREVNQGRLPLMIWRDGAHREVTLALAVMGTYTDRSPWDCPKSRRIVEAGLDHLSGNLSNNIPGRINALALLQGDREDDAEQVRAYFRQLGPPDLELRLVRRGAGGPGDGAFPSWHWSHALVALAEYHLATGDEAVLPAIEAFAEVSAKGQSAFGTWGHAFAYPDENDGELHGRLGGYGALNSAGLTVHYGLVLAQLCGVENQHVDRAVDRANEFFRFYVGKGSIPYGDHEPWKNHNNNGKNALAALIFSAQGQAEPTRYFARMTTASYNEQELGHTGTYFSHLWSPLGVRTVGPEAVAAFLKPQRWYYDLARRWDGSFVYQGPGSYGNWDVTGAYLMTYMLPMNSRLHMTGRGTDTDNALTGERLERTIEAGRGFAARDEGRSFYDQRSAEQLIENLASWSPSVRRWASQALAQKADDQVIAQLLAMLKPTHDLHTRYGACEALAALGRKSADAVPALTAMLEEDDLWLKVQASRALAAIGPPARSALPAILSAAAEVDENDPRRMLQRYLSFALFNRGGMLANDLGQVDREALLSTVAAALTNPDGRARGVVGNVYRHLDYQQLRPILPAILDAIENLAPSGVMFADGIRLAGLDLLTQNHVREAMPLCIEIIEPDRWGFGNRFNRSMSYLERYEGSAKPLIPALRQLRQDLIDGSGNRAGAAPRVDELIEHIESAERSPELRSLHADLEPRVDPRRTKFFENLMREYGLSPNADQ